MGLNSTPLSPFPGPCLCQPTVACALSSKQVYHSKPVCVGFMVGKVIRGQIFLPVFLFLPACVIPPMLRISLPLTLQNVDQ
jgi:hypothetical protein